MKDRAEKSLSLGSTAVRALFFLLLALNIVRTLRHAMWRDELQIFQLGSGSPSLLDLFANLRYQSHPALWDMLVWALASLTPDPMWMQVLHAVIAAILWIVVWRHSPFTRIEKLLLLLGYGLFFEYFIVSRGYALAILLAFTFIALRERRPLPVVLCWALLGLMANIAVHTAIWSMALAIVFVLEERRTDVRFIAGGAMYLALLAAAVVTMIPASDFGPWRASPEFDWRGVMVTPAVTLGAFVPLELRWLHAAANFLAEPQTAPVPFIWNPNPAHEVLALIHADADHPARLAALLSIPVLLCAVLTRNVYRTLEFTLVYSGFLLFAVLWHIPGGARHHGLVFLALIACVWTARSRVSSGPSWLLSGVLAVNALGGMLMLGSEFTTFSQSRNTAGWLERNGFAQMPLIGSRDAQVSSVAGYLGRPVYYLECECVGTFIVWNASRQSPLSAEQFRERFVRALDRTGQREAVLIRNAPLAADNQFPAAISVKLLQSFTGATTDENYWIYRASRI